MAIGARDLYFAVRVEDRATGPLRRIAGEFRALSQRPAMLQQKLVSAQQAEARARDMRLMRAQAFMSARTGTVAIRTEQRIKAAKEETMRTQLRQANVEKQMLQNFAAQTAISGRMSKIKETAGADVVKASAARNARMAAAQQYLSARSGTAAIRTQEKLNAISRQGTMQDLKRASVAQSMRRNYEAQLVNANKIHQLEMEYSADNTLMQQRALMAQATARGVPTERLKHVEGVLPVGLQYEQLLQAQTRLAAEEEILARKAGIIPGVFATQMNSTKALAAASSEATAKEALLSNKFRTSSMSFRQAAGDRKSLAMQYLAASQQAAALSKQEEILAARAGLVPGAFSAQQLELQKVAALTREAEAQRALAASRFRTASQAERDAVAATKSAALAVNSLDWGKLAMAGGLIQKLGRITTTFGVITVAAMGFAAHAYAKFSTESTLAATQSTTQSNNTTAGVLRNSKKISDAILKMAASGKITSPLEDQQKAIYEIFSGIKFGGSQQSQLKQGIGMLKEFNKVATANFGMVDLNEVTSAGIAIVNNFGISLKNLDKVMNVTQAAVRFGKMNMREYTTSLNQAIPAARAAGYTYDQMAASVSFLSKKFPSLRFGTTGYARLLQTLARDTTIKGLAERGVKITDATGKNLLPLDQVITRITKKFPQLAKGGVLLQNFFKTVSGNQGTQQANRVFATLAQDIPGYEKHIQLVTKDNNELAKSWQAMNQSPQVRWTEFTLQIKALVMQIAAGAIPAFAGIGHYVKNLAGWFQDLSPHTKRMIGYFLAMAGIVATLGGVLAMIVGSFAILIVRVKELGGWLSKLFVGKNFAAETGSITTRLAKFGGVLSAIIVLLPILHKLTGSWGKTIALLISGVSTFMTLRLVARLGEIALKGTALKGVLASLAAGPWGIIITVAIVGAAYVLKRLHDLKQAYLDAEARPVSKTVVDTLTPGLEKRIKAMRKAGKSIADIARELEIKMGAATKMAYSRTRTFEGPLGQKITVPDTKSVKIKVIDAQRSQQAIQVVTAAIVAYKKAMHEADSQDSVTADRALQTAERFKQAADKINKASSGTGVNVHSRAFAMAHIPEMIKNLNMLRRAQEDSTDVKKILQYTNYQARLQKLLKAFPGLYDAISQAAGVAFDKTSMLSNAAAFTIAKGLEQDRRTLEKKPSLAGWVAYYTSLDALNKQTTSNQQQAIQEMLQTVNTITDAAALREAQRLDRIKTRLEKAPSLAGWRAYYAALDSFNKNTTSNQQQAVQQMMDATAAAIQKAKDKITAATQGLQSMYDQFFQANKAAFGQLLSGSFLQGLNDQVEAIRKAGSDEAQAIRDAASKIAEQISATQGNLIDWGLIPNPQDAADAMNKSADAIEAAASKRADELQKRLAEHRLTPDELLKDLQSQVAAYKHWVDELNKLKAAGAPQTLIDQLRQLGPEYVHALEGMLNMTPEQWQKYLATWKEGQALIRKQTQKDLNDQLSIYLQHGKNIALAIISGIQSEDKNMTDVIRNIIIKLFPELAKAAGLKASSAVNTSALTKATKSAGAITSKSTIVAPKIGPSSVGTSTGGGDTYNTNSYSTPQFNYYAGSDGNMDPDTYFRKMKFLYLVHKT